MWVIIEVSYVMSLSSCATICVSFVVLYVTAIESIVSTLIQSIEFSLTTAFAEWGNNQRFTMYVALKHNVSIVTAANSSNKRVRDHMRVPLRMFYCVIKGDKTQDN
jgi:hypothetical protein